MCATKKKQRIQNDPNAEPGNHHASMTPEGTEASTNTDKN